MPNEREETGRPELVMNKETTAILLRLLLFWFFLVNCDATLAFIIQRLSMHSDPVWPVEVFSVFIIIFLGTGVFVWRSSYRIAGWLIGRSKTEAKPGLSPDNLLSVGCGLLGIWFAGSAIPTLIVNAIVLLSQGNGGLNALIEAQLGSQALKLVVGLVLVLGRKNIPKGN